MKYLILLTLFAGCTPNVDYQGVERVARATPGQKVCYDEYGAGTVDSISKTIEGRYCLSYEGKSK